MAIMDRDPDVIRLVALALRVIRGLALQDDVRGVFLEMEGKQLFSE